MVLQAPVHREEKRLCFRNRAVTYLVKSNLLSEPLT